MAALGGTQEGANRRTTATNSPSRGGRVSRAQYLKDLEDVGYEGDPNKPGSASGGAGGKRRKSSADVYAQALQQLLTSGAYGQGANELLAAQTQGNQKLQELLGTISGQSEATINTSAQNLQNMLQAQQNPYANFQVQAAQTTPQLEQLLQTQGAQTDPLAQFVAATNAANQAQAGAFQNVANIGANAWQQGQQQMLGNVEAQRLADLQALQNNKQQQEIALQQQLAGFQAQAAGTKDQSRNQMLQLLLSALQAGGRPLPGVLFK